MNIIKFYKLNVTELLVKEINIDTIDVGKINELAMQGYVYLKNIDMIILNKYLTSNNISNVKQVEYNNYRGQTEYFKNEEIFKNLKQLSETISDDNKIIRYQIKTRIKNLLSNIKLTIIIFFKNK